MLMTEKLFSSPKQQKIPFFIPLLEGIHGNEIF